MSMPSGSGPEYPPSLVAHIQGEAVRYAMGNNKGLISPLSEFKSPVKIFTCGGTIDRAYNPDTGDLEFGHPPVALQIVEQASIEDVTVQEIMRINSLLMTDEHREEIHDVLTAETNPGDRIVLTHGTDSAAATARFLGARLLDRTIVITGARKPYSMNNSDAATNVSGAVTAARLLPPSVWISLYGSVTPFMAVETDDTRFVRGVRGDVPN